MCPFLSRNASEDKNIGSYLSNTQSIQCMICNNRQRNFCVNYLQEIWMKD